MKAEKDNKTIKDAAEYAGVAIDASDNETADAQTEAERTDVLDSNPRIDPTDIEEIPS